MMANLLKNNAGEIQGLNSIHLDSQLPQNEDAGLNRFRIVFGAENP